MRTQGKGDLGDRAGVCIVYGPYTRFENRGYNMDPHGSILLEKIKLRPEEAKRLPAAIEIFEKHVARSKKEKNNDKSNLRRVDTGKLIRACNLKLSSTQYPQLA
ncbi:hypothetical protein VTP01DRAFT_5383 [Rhizomucor pusillus]|uniref:uncharacterized protein n=1 Tax=Rhizomucor pusillus TaxID=4840 RepID=UPI003743EDCD